MKNVSTGGAAEVEEVALDAVGLVPEEPAGFESVVVVGSRVFDSTLVDGLNIALGDAVCALDIPDTDTGTELTPEEVATGATEKTEGLV
jgi:hypothetical protein